MTGLIAQKMVTSTRVLLIHGCAVLFEAFQNDNTNSFFDPAAPPEVWSLRRFLAARQFNVVFPTSELHVLCQALPLRGSAKKADSYATA